MQNLSSSSMQERTTVSDSLQYACSVIKEGDLGNAVTLIEEALALDYDSQDVIVSLKYVRYWYDRLYSSDYSNKTEDFVRGQYLLEQWRSFIVFVEKNSEIICKDCLFALKHHIFHLALEAFQNSAEGEKNNSELFLNIARCHREMGKTEDAIKFFQRAHQCNKQDPVILSEFADLHAVMGEMRIARLLFREAFFIDPQKINYARLESGLLTALFEITSEKGYTETVAREWLPVYGVLRGVFSIKRELRPVEFGQLQQSVYQMEQDLRQVSQIERDVLIPKLINRYFWLIDQFVCMPSSQEKIDGVLLKLRKLHPDIYQKYVE